MKFLFPLPIAYDGNEHQYLQRDGARFAEYLGGQGHDAVKLVIDNENGLPSPTSPLLGIAKWIDWCSMDFWKSQKADAILLYGGMSPKLFPVATAIKQANIPLALKMDAAYGVLPFPKDFFRIYRRSYFYARQKHSPIRSVFDAFIREAKRASGKNLRFIKKYFPLFDVIAVESEMAADNTIRWMNNNKLENLSSRVTILYHPVPDAFTYNDERPKKKQILTIAQAWKNPRKGGVLFAKILANVLSERTDYEGMIIGNDSDAIVACATNISPMIKGRVHHKAKCNSIDTLAHYQTSNVFVTCSGAEGSPNVVSEALCCGCSVLFPPELNHLSYIPNSSCGSMASRRSTSSMSAALLSECEKWDAKEYNPNVISTMWSNQMHTSCVAKKLFSVLNIPV